VDDNGYPLELCDDKLERVTYPLFRFENNQAQTTRTRTTHKNIRLNKLKGKTMAVHLAKQCAEELAGLAEKVLEKVPEADEWSQVRHFLKDTSKLLRRGDLFAGMSAFQRVLPYVEKAVQNVDRCVKVSDAYQLTETLTEHFLVDDETRRHIQDFLEKTRLKVDILKADIETFSAQMDEMLYGITQGKTGIGFYEAVKLAFQMNRMSAQIVTCEERLKRARKMIDDLDTHVAGKNLLANIVYYVAFMGSILLSASGNLPAGAACLATATASKKSAQSLVEYRQQLSQIDRDHQELESELNEWHFRLRAEQRNFFLLAGLKYFVLMLVLLAACFLILGKAANFLFFALISIFIVAKAEETNKARYYVALSLAVCAMVMEFQKYNGLVAFNTGSAIFLSVQFLGFLEII